MKKEFRIKKNKEFQTVFKKGNPLRIDNLLFMF